VTDDLRSLDDHARSDAEVKLLATVVKNSAPPDYNAYSDMRCEVTESAFMDPGMKSVFVAIDSVVNAGEHLTPHTLNERLPKGPEGKDALLQVLSYARTDHARTEHMDQYSRLMKQSHVPTKMRNILSSAVADLESGRAVHDVHTQLDMQMDEVVRADRPAAADFIPLRSAAHTALEDLRVIWGGDEKSRPFIPTQFLQSNALMGGGLYRKHMNFVAARPSVGKTAIWEQVAAFVAEAGVGVIVLSLEMTLAEHMLRCAIRDSCIRTSMQDLMSPSFLEEVDASGTPKVRRLEESLSGLSELPIRGITQTRELNEVVRRILRCIRTWPEDWPKPGLIVIDYLQLIRARGTGAWSRTDEVATVANTIRDICIAENLAGMPLAQLNRNIEEQTSVKVKDGKTQKSQGRLPRMSDLRESGQLEQDAHNIWFPHRDIMQDAPETGRQDSLFVFGKCRSGTPGLVSTLWEGPRIMYTERGFGWMSHASGPDAEVQI
jgi:replicative DNA helicase